MKENLISTDLGLLSSDNANWLYKQGVVNREGGIKFNLVNGMVNKKVQLYSYFRWIVDNIKGTIPSAPKQVTVDTDSLISLMRFGEINIPYMVGEEQYHYIARYPVVHSLYDAGRKNFVEHTPKGKDKKKDFAGFDD